MNKIICEVCGSEEVEILSRDFSQGVDLYTYKCKACTSVVDMKNAFLKKQEKLEIQRQKEEKLEDERRAEEERQLEQACQSSVSVAEEIYENATNKILEITSSFCDCVSFGTGFYISSDGYFLTNAHVVMQMQKSSDSFLDNLADNIYGKNINTNKSNSLELIFADLENDIALLKADVEDVEYLVFSSAKPKTGQDIFAIGNSKGEGMCILQGIISDASRKINGNTLIMFSALVTQGNSGGPLLNKNGECIGIVVSGRKESVAMNYAIPLETIKVFLAKAIESEDLDLEI